MLPAALRRYSLRSALLGLAAALASFGLTAPLEAQQQDEPAWEDQPYTIMDGKVDFGTYNGYRRYHSHCHVCHGPDGLGSSYAPALTESLPRIGYEGFVEAVVYGIENVSQTQQSVMPAFGEVEDVMNYMDDIYSYLKARADGALARGRPERLPAEASN
jgi:methanol metabolism-related c-type cytochrome